MQLGAYTRMVTKPLETPRGFFVLVEARVAAMAW